MQHGGCESSASTTHHPQNTRCRFSRIQGSADACEYLSVATRCQEGTQKNLQRQFAIQMSCFNLAPYLGPNGSILSSCSFAQNGHLSIPGCQRYGSPLPTTPAHRTLLSSARWQCSGLPPGRTSRRRSTARSRHSPPAPDSARRRPRSA